MNAVARRERRAPEPLVDFSSVPPSQWKMHDRLENWAKWSRGSPGRVAKSSPMFALYKSSDSRRDRREYGAETIVPIDSGDATRVTVGVTALPDKHRRSIHWLYLHGGRNPAEASRELGLTKQALADTVKAARQMLINQKV